MRRAGKSKVELPQAVLKGGSSDGIRLQLMTGVYSSRSETAAAILSQALLHRVFMIAAPPMTGKTAILQLINQLTLGSVIDEHGAEIFFEVSYTACVFCDSLCSFEDAYNTWNGSPFDQVHLTPKRCPPGMRPVRLLLVDEVQVSCIVRFEC